MKFHSKFGGLWIDKEDFKSRLQIKAKELKWDFDSVDEIISFVENGFVILKDACNINEIDEFERQISEAFLNGHKDLFYQLPGDPQRRNVTEGINRRGIRIVDAYAHLSAAKALLSSVKIVSFLSKIFECDPLLFQSLSFDMGSGQGLHQDTAYVVVDKPLQLAAAWIALEDVKPGSGELLYVPGSHRLPDAPFWGDKKHWNPDLDGFDSHNEWANWLVEESNRRGLKVQSFYPKKGDALIWHADLVHGGSKITNPLFTRKSLVGHYCPKSASPNYFGYAPNRSKVTRERGVFFSSEYYDIE
jgi:phytanoyl-CoA hydroxylase